MLQTWYGRQNLNFDGHFRRLFVNISIFQNLKSQSWCPNSNINANLDIGIATFGVIRIERVAKLSFWNRILASLLNLFWLSECRKVIFDVQATTSVKNRQRGLKKLAVIGSQKWRSGRHRGKIADFNCDFDRLADNILVVWMQESDCWCPNNNISEKLATWLEKIGRYRRPKVTIRVSNNRNFTNFNVRILSYCKIIIQKWRSECLKIEFHEIGCANLELLQNNRVPGDMGD